MSLKIEGRRALIGRGFVGQNLNQPGRFTNWYHSKNIEEMTGHYDLIVCAAPSAAKWFANSHPELDKESLENLIRALCQVTTDKMILISTIDAARNHTYGKHRAALEDLCLRFFTNACVIRLPALYGPGLKKNALFDLLTGDDVANNDYHWYPIRRLWDDIQKAKPGLTCLYSDILQMAEIADAYSIPVNWKKWDSKNDYDEPGPYIMTSEEVLKDIGEFIKEWRETSEFKHHYPHVG